MRREKFVTDVKTSLVGVRTPDGKSLTYIPKGHLQVKGATEN